jgi:hypothetical protein
MKQFIFLAFLCGFLCQSSFAQNADSVDILLEKYGHKTKMKYEKPEKSYKNIFIMVDFGQVMDNYPALLFSIEHSIGKKFKLFHELGPMLTAEWHDPNYDYDGHFGFKTKQEIRFFPRGQEEEELDYWGIGIKINYSDFDEVPLVERFGTSSNNTVYFKSRHSSLNVLTYGVYASYGRSYIFQNHFILSIGGGLGYQYIEMNLPELTPEGSYVKRSLPSLGNTEGDLLIFVSAKLGYRF